MNHPALLTLAALIALSPSARSQGLDRARVPATARWLAHLDVQALRGSSIGRLLTEGAGEDDGPIVDMGSLREFEEEYGFDPTQEVRSLTLYGAGPSHRDAVAILVASAAVDTLVERLRERGGYRSIELEGAPVHAWTEAALGDGAEVFLHVAEGSTPTERVLTLAESAVDLARAVRVRGGHEASLASSPAPSITAVPGPGTFFFVASSAGVGALSEIASASQVAELVRSFAFELGELGETAFARLAVETASPEDAANFAAVAGGLRALASLATRGEGRAMPFASLVDLLSVEARGSQVVVDAACPVRELVQRLEDAEGR